MALRKKVGCFLHQNLAVDEMACQEDVQKVILVDFSNERRHTIIVQVLDLVLISGHQKATSNGFFRNPIGVHECKQGIHLVGLHVLDGNIVILLDAFEHGFEDIAPSSQNQFVTGKDLVTTPNLAVG